jgi:hypothetical protein
MKHVDYTIQILIESEGRYRPNVVFPWGSEYLPTYKTHREALMAGLEFIAEKTEAEVG